MIRYALSLSLIWWLLWVSPLLLVGGCATPTPERRVSADSELTRMMSAARAAFARGSINQAASLYHSALMRARAMDSPSAIADAAYNLSACYTRQGKYAKARALLEEAKTETLLSGGNLADILIAEAKVARLQGHLDEALSLTEEVTSHRASTPKDSHRMQVYLVRGHVASDQEKVRLAFKELEAAAKYAKNVSDPDLQAGLSGLAGRIYLMNKEPTKAARAFDRQMTFLKRANRHQNMVFALQKAAEAYMTAGNSQLASDRFFRAARSAFAQGDEAGAVKLGNKAMVAAEATGDDRAMARTRALLDEIEDAVAKPR